MAENQDFGEVRKLAIAAMPNGLGELYSELWTEVAWLHLKWNQYRELFATSEEQVTVMNQAAPAFFGDLQRTLWEDVLCSVSTAMRQVGS